MPRDNLGDLAALRYYDNMWQGSQRGSVHAVHDLGELAARLGSPNLYDRRGDVIFMDSFNDGLTHWTSVTFGTGGGIEISQYRTRTGPYALKMTPGTNSTRRAQLYRVLPPHPTTDTTYPGWGLEFSFIPHEDLEYTIWDLRQYTGTTLYNAQVRYNHPAHSIEYLDEDGAWQELATDLDLHSPITAQYSTGKLVINPITHAYMRFLLNDTQYTFPTTSLDTAANTNPPGIYVEIRIDAQSGLGANPSAYIDDIILTQNEPT